MSSLRKTLIAATLLGVIAAMTGCAAMQSMRAERALARGDYERAVANLSRLLERDLPDDERAENLVRLAVAIDEGSISGEGDPIAHLDEAIRLAPQNATAHLIRAQMRAPLGDPGAVSDADTALARAESPDSVFLAAAGDSYLIAGSPESAITVYERALHVGADEELALRIHRNLAIAYRDVLDFERAAMHSAQHIALVRDFGTEPSVNALAFHTTLQWLNNDIDAAVTMLQSGALPPSERRRLIETFADPNLNAALAAADRRGR